MPHIFDNSLPFSSTRSSVMLHKTIYALESPNQVMQLFCRWRVHCQQKNCHANIPVTVPPSWKILPSTSCYFESWLYHNTSNLITYSALHFPRPFCFSLPLLRCAFIRRLIHIQIMSNYRPELGSLHSISEFLMLFKYLKYIIIWHINH